MPLAQKLPRGNHGLLDNPCAFDGIGMGSNVQMTRFRAAVAVHAPTRLDDRIQPCQSPKTDGEVKVNSCFDQLGGNQPTGLTLGKPFLDRLDRVAAVRWRHERGKVKAPLFRQKLKKFIGVLARVDNTKHLLMFSESPDQFLIFDGTKVYQFTLKSVVKLGWTG